MSVRLRDRDTYYRLGADAVDRAGMTCYSTVYALYNIAYSVGMIAASGIASLTADALGFRGALLTVSAVLLLSTLLLVSVAPEASVAQEPGRVTAMQAPSTPKLAGEESSYEPNP